MSVVDQEEEADDFTRAKVFRGKNVAKNRKDILEIVSRMGYTPIFKELQIINWYPHGESILNFFNVSMGNPLGRNQPHCGNDFAVRILKIRTKGMQA